MRVINLKHEKHYITSYIVNNHYMACNILCAFAQNIFMTLSAIFHPLKRFDFFLSYYKLQFNLFRLNLF